ncbi:lactococcin 972 family bacteriocin [Cellulosimicrobium cellulans]|uniref:lactococcin 972 family bacteriocin n=1 Tax=Cellulosimicrobium cellulans TaxID=1710 RepID=UPI003820536A
MRRIVAAACTAALAIGIGLGTAGPAAAGLEYRDGGKWYWQYTSMILESNYFHSGRTHKSSTTTPHQTVNSGWKVPGVWAYASDYPNPAGGNACNYGWK